MGWRVRSTSRTGGTRPAHRRGAGRIRLVATLLSVCALCSVIAVVAPVSAITSTTINIDGDLSDWAGIRTDPQNAVSDTQITDPDPDYPGQPDRDVYLVNATWDSRFLYLAFRRTAGGTKAITFGAYIDRGNDGLLQGSDIVCSWTVNQSASGRYADAHASSPTAHILRYNQAIVGKGGPYLHPAGDPMGYDGETPDGWADVQSGEIFPVDAMDGWMASNGIEFEGRVAWSDLGLAAGSPIAIHFVNANGESFGVKWVPSDTRKWIGNPPQYVEENRGQVEDNVDGLWWLRLQGVALTPNNTGGGQAGETLVYDHIVRNTGNSTTTFDLSATSSRGWVTQVTGSTGTPLTDVTLAPGESSTVRVSVTIPAGTTDGARDTTTLRAVSQTSSTVIATATDTTVCGRVTVTPDQSATMAPGQIITYTFNVTNNMAASQLYDLTTSSTLGWPAEVTDTNGAVISSVSLGAGESVQVCVKVQVPTDATIGAQDLTRLTATLRDDAAIKASATAATTAQAGLTLSPNRAASAGANSTVDYSHTVSNSWPTTRTITLSSTSSQGWTVRYFAADGVTQVNSVTLGPNGASTTVIARVYVPAGVSTGAVDTTTLRATTGTTTATATDVTTIRRLAVYDSSGYTSQVATYSLTDTVYGRAAGLSPGSEVTFVWKDATGAIVRTSPGRTVDTAGMAFDSYPTKYTDATGGWILELHAKDGTLLETTPFTVKWKASITALSATDAPGVGDTVAITSSVSNGIDRPIANSTLKYTIWWDTDGGGSFNAGDTWIDASGAPHIWDGVTAVSSHVTTGVNVAANGTWSEQTPWTVSNSQFPAQGTYRVTEAWTDSNGLAIDTKTTQFYSIPVLGWPLFTLASLLGAGWLWYRRDELGAAPETRPAC